MALNKWTKWWQKLILDSLMTKTPPPLTIILMVVFGAVFGVGFFCAHWMDQVDFAYYKSFSILTDNIGGVAFNVMSDILPVDVVYTWVNGSDPQLLSEIEAIMKSNHSNACTFQNCFPANYYSISSSVATSEPSEEFEVLKSIPAPRGAPSEIILLVKLKKKLLDLATLQHRTEADWATLQQRTEAHFGVNATIHRAYWTSDSVLQYGYEMKNALLMRLDRDGDIRVLLHEIDPEKYEQYMELCPVVRNEDTIVLECTDDTLAATLRTEVLRYRNETKMKFPQLFPAFLVLRAEKRNQAFDFNRFGDNEELRYSLRSLEKYAPWVRRIFLVTNGQVPYWLNLDHPKLTVVTHDQIFRVKSHLPSYSSPAIESHIHRIPGLSNHFLYFNDDIMLGAPIYPDDFFSISSGYKIYLSWPLPECSSGCPASWIRDGYCDRSCNTSECNFDGGDCTTKEGISSPDYDGENVVDVEAVDDCHNSCTDSWLADGYCDPVCSTLFCGYDAGDCGVEVLKNNLFEIPFQNAEVDQTFHIPRGHLSAWMNLSSLLEEKDVSGEYLQSKGIRAAAVNTQNKVAVFVFNFNVSGLMKMRLNITDKSNRIVSQSRTMVQLQIYFNTKPILEERDVSTSVDIEHFSFANASPNIREKFNVSHVTYAANNDSLRNYPEEVQLSLTRLDRLFEDGFLTPYGWNLKRNIVLHSYETKFTKSRKLLFFDENVDQFGPQQKASSVSNFSPGKRKLLDEFSNSLLFVNRLYNSKYGFASRKVPAHMPHYIDKTILKELHRKFSTEFYITSSHKFRDGNDMQFAFSYYYFLMNEEIRNSVGDIFDLFDTDNSGTWSDREIRTFLAKTNSLPLRYDDVMGFQKELKSCYEQVQPKEVSVMPYERYADSNLPTISKELMEKCNSSLFASRMKPFETRSRFHYTAITDPPVHFKMISSNLSSVIYNLDQVRKIDKKFVCLNSDMDPHGSDNDLIRALVQDTFESLYPVASSFELPLYYRNRFAYIWQVKQWKTWRNFLRALIYASVACLLILVALTFFSSQLEAFKRRLCKRRRRNLLHYAA